MLESIGKGNLWVIVVDYMAKTNNHATRLLLKRLQHQNRKKYETIVEEIRLQLSQVM